MADIGPLKTVIGGDISNSIINFIKSSKYFTKKPSGHIQKSTVPAGLILQAF